MSGSSSQLDAQIEAISTEKKDTSEVPNEKVCELQNIYEKYSAITQVKDKLILLETLDSNDIVALRELYIKQFSMAIGKLYSNIELITNYIYSH